MRVGVLHGASVVVVHHVFRPDATFQVLEVGAQLPVARERARQGDPRLRRPTPSSTTCSPSHCRSSPRRTLTPRALRAELDDVRERGVARERDEAVLGESSVAAPIFDHGGHAVGAIGVVGDTERDPAARPGQGHHGRGHRRRARRLARARRPRLAPALA